MKQVHNSILLFLTGLLCGWTGCEKDDPAMNDALIDDCANQIIDRRYAIAMVFHAGIPATDSPFYRTHPPLHP